MGRGRGVGRLFRERGILTQRNGAGLSTGAKRGRVQGEDALRLSRDLQRGASTRVGCLTLTVVERFTLIVFHRIVAQRIV